MRQLSVGEQMLVQFATAWEQAHGEKFIIMWGGKDSKAAKDLAATGISMDDFTARLRAYLSDAKWWELCRHSFTGFAYNLNKFVPVRARTQATQPQTENATVDDEGHRVEPGKLCELCYPLCAKCNERHYKEQSCEEAAEFLAVAKRIAGRSKDARDAKEPTSIASLLKRT